jgi:cell division protein ZapA
MAKLSLKVVVAGRTYPLSVNESEEQRVLKAAEDINKSIQMLKDNYAVRDVQDLLAMTALQLASKSESPKTEAPKSGGEAATSKLTDFQQKLESLSDELDQLK